MGKSPPGMGKGAPGGPEGVFGGPEGAPGGPGGAIARGKALLAGSLRRLIPAAEARGPVFLGTGGLLREARGIGRVPGPESLFAPAGRRNVTTGGAGARLRPHPRNPWTAGGLWSSAPEGRRKCAGGINADRRAALAGGARCGRIPTPLRGCAACANRFHGFRRLAPPSPVATLQRPAGARSGGPMFLIAYESRAPG